MPPTQALGQAAYDVGGIVGLKYRSSKNISSGFAIVVFTDRLDPAKNLLQLYNKATGLLQQKLP
jgi:hypothetical protein